MEKLNSHTIYNAEPVLWRFRQTLSLLGRDLGLTVNLAWRFFVRDLRAKHRQSLLGYVWVVLPAIFSTLVFVLLKENSILMVGETKIPYPCYVLLGTGLWQLFAESVNAPMSVMKGARNILTRVNFPTDALVLAKAGDLFMNFCLRMILFFVLMLYFRVQPDQGLIYAPIGIVMIVLAGLSVGFILTPFGMLYQDIQRGLGYLLGLWFFLTPVVYPPSQTGLAGMIQTWNPMSPIILTTRDLLTGQAVGLPFLFIAISIGITLSVFVAWFIYRITICFWIERMGA